MKLTGNRAELRFPAAQILKWAAGSPVAYLATCHIFVLSAFFTSILSADISPVDTGDGWGTNLNNMNIRQPGWSREVLSVMDEYLKANKATGTLPEKIGHMDHYDSMAGSINPYFIQKYGLRPETIILNGTGDNPASLLGCGGKVMVSLGSSYTLCGVMDRVIPSSKAEYNIFGYTPGSAMALSVFTNGGKVHDEFIRRYLHLPDGYKPKTGDWENYIDLGGELRLPSTEHLMLPYLLDESVPLQEKGVVRQGFSRIGAGVNIRALHLSQVLSLRIHSGHLGKAEELCLVAGGAQNRLLRQWIADAFNAPTCLIRNADVAAPFGCALSGAVKVLGLSYQEAAERFIQKDRDSVCRPLASNVKAMKHLIGKYQALEDQKQN
jgi:xylulokinase